MSSALDILQMHDNFSEDGWSSKEIAGGGCAKKLTTELPEGETPDLTNQACAKCYHARAGWIVKKPTNF